MKKLKWKNKYKGKSMEDESHGNHWLMAVNPNSKLQLLQAKLKYLIMVDSQPIFNLVFHFYFHSTVQQE